MMKYSVCGRVKVILDKYHDNCDKGDIKMVSTIMQGNLQIHLIIDTK